MTELIELPNGAVLEIHFRDWSARAAIPADLEAAGYVRASRVAEVEARLPHLEEASELLQMVEYDRVKPDWLRDRCWAWLRKLRDGYVPQPPAKDSGPDAGAPATTGQQETPASVASSCGDSGRLPTEPEGAEATCECCYGYGRAYCECKCHQEHQPAPPVTAEPAPVVEAPERVTHVDARDLIDQLHRRIMGRDDEVSGIVAAIVRYLAQQEADGNALKYWSTRARELESGNSALRDTERSARGVLKSLTAERDAAQAEVARLKSELDRMTERFNEEDDRAEEWKDTADERLREVARLTEELEALLELEKAARVKLLPIHRMIAIDTKLFKLDAIRKAGPAAKEPSGGEARARLTGGVCKVIVGDVLCGKPSVGREMCEQHAAEDDRDWGKPPTRLDGGKGGEAWVPKPGDRVRRFGTSRGRVGTIQRFEFTPERFNVVWDNGHGVSTVNADEVIETSLSSEPAAPPDAADKPLTNGKIEARHWLDKAISASGKSLARFGVDQLPLLHEANGYMLNCLQEIIDELEEAR